MPHPGSTAERGPINLYDPVNRNHPLNRGRVAWWLTLPGWDGGRTWPDLMGLNPGTLTSMGNSSNGWRPTARPGGFGSVLFDGTAGLVAVPDSPSLEVAGSISFGAWASCTGGTGTYRTIMVKQYDSSWTGNLAVWALRVNGPSNSAYCWVVDGNDVGNATPGSTFPADGSWHRLIATYDRVTLRLYQDGLLAASTSYSAALPASAFPLCIGSHGTTDVGANWVGRLDDLTVWNRALSAAEVAADYDLSARGYPGVLNRH